jgi:hypothetical protein
MSFMPKTRNDGRAYDTHVCSVCRRPVARRERGRPREVHTSCCIVRSRVAELETLLLKMRFGDVEAARQMRGDLFALVNCTLRASVVRIEPENDSDI